MIFIKKTKPKDFLRTGRGKNISRKEYEFIKRQREKGETWFNIGKKTGRSTYWNKGGLILKELKNKYG